MGQAHDVVIASDYALAAAHGYLTGLIRGIEAPPGMQAGGLASGLIMVGERGPELVNVPPGTRVFSREETEALLPRMFSTVRTPPNVAPSRVVVEGPVVEFSGPVTVRENADIDRIVHRVNRSFYDAVREVERARGM
jgi:hypothetical protein